MKCSPNEGPRGIIPLICCAMLMVAAHNTALLLIEIHCARMPAQQPNTPAKLNDITNHTDDSTEHPAENRHASKHGAAPINSAEQLYKPAGHDHRIASHLSDEKLAPLTRWAQERIFENQYVSDCSGSEIMLTDGYESGFGSEIHVIGAMLGYSMEHKHTLVLGPSSCKAFTDSNACTQGCACLFRPITNCDYHSTLQSNPDATKISLGSIQIGTTTHAHNQRQLLESSKAHFDVRNTVPTLFRNALIDKIPSISGDQIKYWWRAQSAAFLMRFNNATVEAVASLRHNSQMHYYTNRPSAPFPLPASTIAIHIRGGDKWREMTLIHATKYINAAIENIRNMPLSFSQRVVFTSADDPEKLALAREQAEQENLTFAFTHLPRQDGGHSLSAWLQEGNKADRFYGHLLQLLMSLEADSWIGTRASNWNRLIDELRCVWVDKCQNMFTEVGDLFDEYNW
jgi:hypothetical protein